MVDGGAGIRLLARLGRVYLFVACVSGREENYSSRLEARRGRMAWIGSLHLRVMEALSRYFEPPSDTMVAFGWKRQG